MPTENIRNTRGVAWCYLSDVTFWRLLLCYRHVCPSSTLHLLEKIRICATCCSIKIHRLWLTQWISIERENRCVDARRLERIACSEYRACVSRSRGNHFTSKTNSGGGLSYVTNILIYSAKYLAGAARAATRCAMPFESEISPAQARNLDYGTCRCTIVMDFSVTARKRNFHTGCVKCLKNRKLQTKINGNVTLKWKLRKLF